MTRTALTTLALLAAGAASAADVSAELILAEGDIAGSTGSAVDFIYEPHVNPDGSVGFIAENTDDSILVLNNTSVIWDDATQGATPLVDDGDSSTGSATAFGTFSYTCTLAGTFDDALYTEQGLLLAEADPAPVLPAPAAITFLYEPRSHSGGGVSWLASVNDQGLTSSNGRVLYYSPDGSLSGTTVLFSSYDGVGGIPLTASSTAIANNSVRVSDNAQHYIFEADLDQTPDAAIVVDGVVVALEGDVAPGSTTGDAWSTFDRVDITDAGDYIFSGDTNGSTTADEFVAYNGTIIATEGAVLTQTTIPQGTVIGASINSSNQIAHTWDPSTTGEPDTLFVTCDPSDAVNTTRQLLAVGDFLDFDGDGVFEAELLDLNGTSTGNQDEYTDDNFVYLDVDVDFGLGTTEAMIKVAANCCPDADADGQCDVDDPCPNSNPDDIDGDGVCGDVDVCDGDDAAGDFDGDGVCDDIDVCPLDVNDDSDGDGFCDTDDLCDGSDFSGDSDGDGICDDSDFGLLISRVAPGDNMTFFAFNAPVGEMITFAVSNRGLGDDPTVGSTSGNLDRAFEVGTVMVGIDGTARLDLTVPNVLSPGDYLYFQALYDGDLTEVVVRRARNPLP